MNKNEDEDDDSRLLLLLLSLRNHGSWWSRVDIGFLVMMVKNDEEWIYDFNSYFLGFNFLFFFFWVWCWWMYEDGDEDGEVEEGRRWINKKK
jgi:hypothetical protein